MMNGGWFGGLLVFAGAMAGGAVAQSSATVTVDAGKPINVLTDQLVGAYTQMGDGDLLTDKSLGMMRAAGLNTITYPSGWDDVSQLYHWSTNRLTPNAGNADALKAPYIQGGNDFGHVAAALAKNGMNAIIHVNYGSNMGGTGGGEPKEAAAWVAYANGSPTNGAVIGKDSTGEDWQTVGFWATLRASTPLAADDGYNFLRIGHPAPLHVTLWQIGEDVQDNGYFGGEHKGGFDLHAAYPPSSKDNEKRKKLVQLSPKFYADRIGEYAAAMKAVDPEVKIGASMTTPTVDLWGAEWNSQVLKEGCKDIDFIAFNWAPGGSLPPDYKLLDDASVMHSTTEQLPKVIAETLYDYKTNCPAGKVPRVVLSQASPVGWPKVENAMIKALFAADLYATLGEAGIANASWYQLREDGLIDKNNKPNPAYYGVQMMHIVAFKPGDSYVAVKGGPSTLAVHATRRQDGIVAVLLVNSDPKQTVQVNLNVVGGAALAEAGVRFDYGPAQQAQGAGPARSAVAVSGTGASVLVPANAIVDVLLPMKK